LGESGEPREARSADGGYGASGKTPIGDALLRNDAPLSPKGGRVLACSIQPDFNSLDRSEALL
jgi:hypothetical protein